MYYLVFLYYKTGCKYICSRAKINRLLTIYKFCSIFYNKNCLESEYVVNENPKGSIGIVFPKLSWYLLPQNLYFKENLIKQKQEEITEDFDNFAFIPETYKVDDKVSDLSKLFLETIFRKFGNYPLVDLGNMIDEIVVKMPIKQNYIDKIDTLEFENFLNIKLDNEVFNFVKGFKRTKINKVKVK